MTTDGGEGVGPPVPGGNEQQDRHENSVRGKQERNFGVGETKSPGELRGQIVANAADQNPKHGAAKGLRSFLWQGAQAAGKFAIQSSSSRGIDHSFWDFISTNGFVAPTTRIHLSGMKVYPDM